MTDRDEALGRDVVATAVLRGDFLLRSGQRSSYYIDKYLFTTQPQEPEGRFLARYWRPRRPG